MQVDQVVKLSFQNILANKVRSSLTMLGIIIGVFSVIILVAIGTGIETFIVGQFNALGSNLILVAPGTFEFSDDPAKAFSRNQLDEKHLKLIETHASDVITYVTPSVRISENMEYKTNSYVGAVIGGKETALNIFNYEIADGRFFTEQEVRNKQNVIILGDKVRSELFETRNPIGEQITLGDEKFTVIGTFKSKGQNLDDNAVAPYTAVMNSYNIENFSSLGMKFRDGVDINLAMRRVELALLRDLEEDEFTVFSQADILSSIQNILRILTIGIGAIAGISLIVGGIGIMNIMLVSVTERIHEIGLRKALGATSQTIGLQFMLESLFISLIGGILGMLLGWLGSLAARSFINTTIPWWSVALALGFSSLVGVVFGTYPAYKASKKDPIEALRHE